MGRYQGSPVSCIRKDIRPSARTTVQGKPAARRGRKARDLIETARPPVQERTDPLEREEIVKANLARFTWVLMLLAAMALTVGAGIRWD
jgi:hypothetical protein